MTGMMDYLLDVAPVKDGNRASGQDRCAASDWCPRPEVQSRTQLTNLLPPGANACWSPSASPLVLPLAVVVVETEDTSAHTQERLRVASM